MAWLRSDGSAARSARLMIGAAPGDRVLVGGASYASLAADLALVTGLNGRTVVLDRDPTARDRVEAAAAAAGALVEFTTGAEVSGAGPASAFDLVVLGEDALQDREFVRSATRALRPAGRAIVRLDLQRKSPLGWRTKRPTLRPRSTPASPRSRTSDSRAPDSSARSTASRSSKP